MFTVTRPLSAFVASAGVVAFDRLQVQIRQSTISVNYQTGILDPNNLSQVLLVFDGPLTGADIIALDAIIAAHSGLNLPLGHSWPTNHVILNFAAGTVAVSFVDETHADVGALSLKNARVSQSPGMLLGAVVLSDDNANVTVQLILNGVLVGSGTTLAIVAGVPSYFEIPVEEAEYVALNSLGIALTGLAVGSDSCVDGYWEEAV